MADPAPDVGPTGPASRTTPAPSAGGSFWARKLGPMPVWAWGAVGIGLALIYANYKKNKDAQSAQQTQLTTDTQGLPGNQVAPFVFVEPTPVVVNPTTPTAPPPPAPPPPAPVTPPVTPPGGGRQPTWEQMLASQYNIHLGQSNILGGPIVATGQRIGLRRLAAIIVGGPDTGQHANAITAYYHRLVAANRAQFGTDPGGRATITRGTRLVLPTL